MPVQLPFYTDEERLSKTNESSPQTDKANLNLERRNLPCSSKIGVMKMPRP